VSGSWQAPWNGTFRAGIRNLFNKRPPLTLDVSNSSAAAYDPALDLTRYFFVSYDQKF
jgi:iron complex outermembrane receptor protein